MGAHLATRMIILLMLAKQVASPRGGSNGGKSGHVPARRPNMSGRLWQTLMSSSCSKNISNVQRGRHESHTHGNRAESTPAGGRSKKGKEHEAVELTRNTVASTQDCNSCTPACFSPIRHQRSRLIQSATSESRFCSFNQASSDHLHLLKSIIDLTL